MTWKSLWKSQEYNLSIERRLELCSKLP